MYSDVIATGIMTLFVCVGLTAMLISIERGEKSIRKRHSPHSVWRKTAELEHELKMLPHIDSDVLKMCTRCRPIRRT